MTSPLPAALVPASRSRFPHRPRALLGITAAAGLTLTDLVDGIEEWQRAVPLDRVGRARRADVRSRVGVRIEGTEDLLQESIGAYFDERIAPLDGFMTIDLEAVESSMAELDALVDVLAGIGDGLSGVIDPLRSFAMAGLVNLVRADEGPFAMMLMCSQQPDVELAATHAWWCSFGEVMAHADSGPTLGYHQVQCEPELSRRVASVAGLAATSFDLGDLAYLSSVDEFVARARPRPGPTPDPGPPINQRDDFVTFRGSVGAFCRMVA